MNRPTTMDWVLLTLGLVMRAVSLGLLVSFAANIPSSTVTFGEVSLLAVLVMNGACDWIRDKVKLKGYVK